MNKKRFETVKNYPRRYKRHLPNVSKIVNCNTLLDMDRYSNTKNLHKFLEKYKHSHLFHALPIAKVKAKKKKFSKNFSLGKVAASFIRKIFPYTDPSICYRLEVNQSATRSTFLRNKKRVPECVL